MATPDLARSLMSTGRYEQALHELESCSVVSPDVELDKGMCYAALGRLSRARGVLDGLRLSGFDRHADKLAERLADEAPPSPASHAAATNAEEGSSRKHALMYVVFASLGALLLLEGVYVGAGLVSARSDEKPMQSEAVVPVAPPEPMTREVAVETDDSGVRIIDVGLTEDTTLLLGDWHTVDFVQETSEFRPGQRQSRMDFFLKDLRFADRGMMSMNGQRSAFKWEPGWITSSVDHAKARYAVHNLDGATYLFFPWLNGDVIMGGMRPHFYVLQKMK